jgi:hypothetical protein
MHNTQRPGNPFGSTFRGEGSPIDVLAILGVVFATFALQFFAATAILPALLRLTPRVWASGFVWQIFTYPFIGSGSPNFWIILELYFLFLFARDVFWRLGRRNFWKLLAWACIPAALIALGVDLLMRGIGIPGGQPMFLMQGQWMLAAVLISAYATLNRDATIRLMLILPIRALLFIPLTIVFAFLGFLSTKDLAGFLGICVGVGLTFAFLTPGGIRRLSRESKLRIQEAWYRQRMGRLRRKRGFTVVKGKSARPNDDLLN